MNKKDKEEFEEITNEYYLDSIEYQEKKIEEMKALYYFLTGKKYEEN